MTDFTMSKDGEGIATIVWDCKDKSMNVMTMDAMIALDQLVEDALGDEAVKGIIITSGKADFAGGMDLNVLAAMKTTSGDNPAQGVFDGIMKMHAALRKIELAGMDPKTKKGGKPIATVLPGTAMGIGLERNGHDAFLPRIIQRRKSGFQKSLWACFQAAVGRPVLCVSLGQWRQLRFC